MKCPTPSALAALTLLLSLSFLAGCGKNEEAAGPPPGRPEPVFQVTAAPVVAKPMTAYATLIGAVHWPRRVTLTSDVQGTVTEMAHHAGERFDAGDVLFRLDPTDYEIAKKRAEAQFLAAEKQLALAKVGTRAEVVDQLSAARNHVRALLAQAEDELARTKKLFAETIRTQADLTRAESSYEAAKAQLAEAEARLAEAKAGPIPETVAVAAAQVDALRVEVEAAQRNIDKCVVVAPFAGTVLNARVDLGATVSPGTMFADIVSREQIEVMLEAPERLLGAVQPGDSFALSADAHPGVTFNATVLAIIPMADPQTRNVKFRATITDPSHQLVEGMFVRADFPIATKANAIVAPVDAVTLTDDAKYIFIVRDGVRPDPADATKTIPVKVVERQAITLGLQEGDEVEIIGAVKAGDVVVTTGGEVLNPGALVALPAPPAAAPAPAEAEAPTEKKPEE